MNLEQAFQRLTAGSKAKRLRKLWPAIEQKLAQGVSHAQILGVLNDNGLDLTERTYKSYLYRFRKRRRTDRQRLAPGPLAQYTESQFPDSVLAGAHCASPEPDGHQRPATFEFDPSGISPDLLK